MASKLTVNQYLEGLPQSVQTRLYNSPATSLAIFRLLPSLAKFYVMSIIFNEKPVLISDFDSWINANGKAEQADALRVLRALHLLQETKEYARLNPTFRESFKLVLTGSEKENSFGVVSEAHDSHQVDIDFLDKYAANRWETILHFMVGTELDEIPNQAVLTLLKHSGLMEGKTPKLMKITNEGFQFLLQDVNAQLWALLLQYLRMAETLQMDPVDVLNFIFMLGSLELGKDYSLSALSETQLNMVGDLRDYGLIYQRKSTSRRFYPTRLATTLTSDASTLRTASAAMNKVIENAKDRSAQGSLENAGTIIIETNFKLYAYTNSPLQIAILNLFVHLKQRFSNLVTAQITRESIRKALLNGITAEQIISYLEAHAHPQLVRSAEEQLGKKNESGSSGDTLQILQPTIKDQIKLWQLELDRIVAFEGSLFTDFSNYEEYELLRKYAEEIGCLLWSDSTKRKLFVTEEGKSQLISYAKRHAKKA